MAPVFDNGTSFGYMHPDEKLPNFRDQKLDDFIGKGTHHMSWDLVNEKRTWHMDLYVRASTSLEIAGVAINDVIHGSLAALDDALDACVRLPVDGSFTVVRAEFVRRLLARRGELMMGVLKGL